MKPDLAKTLQRKKKLLLETWMQKQLADASLRDDLTILAAAIYKDFARKTDDMSVIVGKIN